MSLLRREVDRASSTGFYRNMNHLLNRHLNHVSFSAGAKLDASESASEQEEDFELISDEELRSATYEDDEEESKGDENKKE